MKTIMQRVLIVSWLLTCYLSTSMANIKTHGDCEPNCFKSEIISVSPSSDGCTEYEMRVFMTGDCAHALSHYTVEVPACAEISHVSNSENWKQEIASTDPTTGLYGFKIDDIEGFGEDNSNLESFTVNFTICNMASCSEDFSCWAPKVAYKASTCVYYENTEISCVNLAAHLEVQNLSCYQSGDGEISVIIDEGDGPFSYSWSNGASMAVIDNLSAGNYSVEIADAAGNTLTLDTVITEPSAIEVSASVTHASCNGAADGSIVLTTTGGTGSYAYSWSNGATTKDLDQLTAGSYIVNITDSLGCQINERFTVSSETSITVSGEVSRASCSETNGAIDISVTGGAEPYSYSWSNGNTTEDLNDLAPDLYRITVSDANGCSTMASFVVQEDNPLSLEASTTKTGCVEDNTGTIDLTVVGGAVPYSYTWSNGSSTEDLEGLAADMYTVEVTDQNGCSGTLRVVISNQTFDVMAEVNAVSCAGESDGSISLTPSGGVEPYTYEWSNGETEATLSGLAPTLYRVTVTDATGCSKDLTYVVSQPAALSATATVTNPTCESGGYDINVDVSGGSGDYTFSWSSGDVTQNILDVVAGEYSLTVTDSNGCSTTIVVAVSAVEAGCDDDDSGDGTGDGDGDNGDGSGGDGSGEGDDSGDGDDDGSGDDDDGSDGDDGDGGNDGNGNDCDNPFSGDIELIGIEGNCYTYQLTVDYSGQHIHGLSHMSVGLSCGDLSNAENNGNWPIEEGTDPTTGVRGFKVDDISGFGEGSLSDSFETTFTICSEDESCLDQLGAVDFEVAYKYGQCVAYEDIDGTINIASGLIAYPNPFRDELTIEFTSAISTRAVVELYNQQGYKVKTVFEGNLRANEMKRLTVDASAMPVDVYTYRISTDYQVFHGKLIKY